VDLEKVDSQSNTGQFQVLLSDFNEKQQQLLQSFNNNFAKIVQSNNSKDIADAVKDASQVRTTLCI
jgi:hypothetical protein